MENIKFSFHLPSPDKHIRTALQKVRRWKFETQEHSLTSSVKIIKWILGFVQVFTLITC